MDQFLSSGVRFTTPILLAAIGGLPTWWTRDLNIALEGYMLFGAFFGVYFGFLTGSSIVGVACGLAVGLLFGYVFGLVIVRLRAPVFVMGAALNVLALGGTAFLLRVLLGSRGSFNATGITPLPTVAIPGVESIPVIGPMLSGHSILTYISWVLVAVLIWAARCTTIVRHLKAAGEHGEALATAGVNVGRIRLLAQVWCGALCALGGMQLSLGQLSAFTDGMTVGLGFVALAAVIFTGARGSALLLFGVSIVFGLALAASIRAQGLGLPSEIPQMLPYVITLGGLIVVSIRRKGGQQSRMVVPTIAE